MAKLPPFNGVETFASAPERVYDVLTNPDLLRDCVPDVDTCEVVAPNVLKGVVRPKFAFVRGSLSFTLTLNKTVPGKEAVTINESTGIGAKMTIESRLRVEPGAEGRPAGCTVHWEATVREMKGLLAMVPAGLIRGAAEKTIRDTWELVRAKAGG